MDFAPVTHKFLLEADDTWSGSVGHFRQVTWPETGEFRERLDLLDRDYNAVITQ